jgi:DNA-binding winged helix-turn-helix (wHTH) protein
LDPSASMCATSACGAGRSPLPLRHKTLEVLHALVARAGQPLTTEALFAGVWPETAASDTVLTMAIRELRRVLGDQAWCPQFIETVHGRGHRFIAPVTVVEPSSERPQTAGKGHQSQPGALTRPTFFVGREGELAQLQQWFTRAFQGTRQVVFITGAAGMGKTALIDAFVAQVRATEVLWIGHGQGIEQYGPGEPYLPVLEALGCLCRGTEGAPCLALLRRYAPSWLLQMPALLSPATGKHCRSGPEKRRGMARGRERLWPNWRCILSRGATPTGRSSISRMPVRMRCSAVPIRRSSPTSPRAWRCCKN